MENKSKPREDNLSETPHMVIFGQKTAYFGSMKPGHKKKNHQNESFICETTKVSQKLTQH